MTEPTFDPWAVVTLVMQELARTGVKSRFTGQETGAAKTAADALLTAFGVAPVTPPD